MNFPTRRTFLKSAAALSAVPFIPPIAKVVPQVGLGARKLPLGELNVLFHGVFVFMYDKNDPHVLTIYAPNVDGHIYEAGNWGQEDDNPMAQGKIYELKGPFTPPECAPPTTKETKYPVIICENDPASSSKWFSKIRVPMPQRIVPLRSLHREIGFGEFFKGSYAPKHLQHLPLCYALVYKYKAKTVRPYLDGTHWRAPQHPGPANLHVRAELPTMPHCGHEGFNGILDLLGYKSGDLNIADKYGDCRVGPDTSLALPAKKVHGLMPEEEYFLAELSADNGPTDTPGVPQHCNKIRPCAELQPANCSSIHGILGHED
jgi:hypothetical protein